MNRWLSSKDIHVVAIDQWHREIVKIVCKLEKRITTCFYGHTSATIDPPSR